VATTATAVTAAHAIAAPGTVSSRVYAPVVATMRPPSKHASER